MGSALARAIEIVGGQTQLARLLGVKQANVWHWLNKAERVPGEYVLAIETATGYRGLYFVLQGRLSPLDGIGPRELGLDRLAERLGEGEVRELIVATNPTVEGEATAHYLAQLARAHKVHPSRLAHGVPLGGELEYVDRGTLSHAFGSRSEILP